MTLNHAQQQAVTSTASTIVVIAGPGSGKTRVIEQRIRHRIDEGTDPRKIVVLTFTQAGAHELRQRLDIQLGYIGTLHGWCFGLMQKHGQHIGYRAGGITIVPEEAKEQMVKEIMARLQVKIPWSRMTETPLKPDAKLVWDEYRHVLKRSNLCDYDGILKEGYRILKAGCVNLGIDELFVDEIQDSGEQDWEIYKAISVKFKFVVGDSDQSIFGFRSARPDLLIAATKREFWFASILES